MVMPSPVSVLADAPGCVALQLPPRSCTGNAVNLDGPKTAAMQKSHQMSNKSLRVGAALSAITMFALGAAPSCAGSLLLESLNFVVGQKQSDATDINDAGQVAAQYTDSAGNSHAVIWKNGAVTNIPIGYSAFTLRINAQGVAVGAYLGVCCQGPYRAFAYDPVTQLTRTIAEHPAYGAFPNGINSAGVIVGDAVGAGLNPIFKGWEDNNTLTKVENVKNALSTDATSINDAGTIAGWYTDAASVSHGFTRTGSKTSTIDPPGSTATYVDYIAADGTAVGGYSDAASVYHGFTEKGGVYTTFDYPGSAKTLLFAYSASGEAVGTWKDTGGVSHGLIWIGGTYYSFDYPGSTYTVIMKANAGGSIVGLYIDAAGISHGFVGLCAAGQAPCTSGHVG